MRTLTKGLLVSVSCIATGAFLFILGITDTVMLPKAFVGVSVLYLSVGSWGIGLWMASRRFINYLNSKGGQR